MEYFDHDNLLLAKHYKNVSKYENKNFLTERIDELQAGILNFNKNDVVQNHIHFKQDRSIKKTTEILFIISGIANVNIFDTKKIFIDNFTARKDSLIIFFDGGHGIKFSEDSKILEVKQGPYIEAKDKEKF